MHRPLATMTVKRTHGRRGGKERKECSSKRGDAE